VGKEVAVIAKFQISSFQYQLQDFRTLELLWLGVASSEAG
jgi:hypothetical protein